MGTAQFSDMCIREPFHRVTLDSYFHSSQHKSGPTIPLHPQTQEAICGKQLPAGPYQASVGSRALRTPRTPCGPATPHPCWQRAAITWQSCCMGCLQAQSCPCLMASAGWQQTNLPTAVLGCPFPRDLAALLPPAQMHVLHVNKMQLFPPPKMGSPSCW